MRCTNQGVGFLSLGPCPPQLWSVDYLLIGESHVAGSSRGSFSTGCWWEAEREDESEEGESDRWILTLLYRIWRECFWLLDWVEEEEEEDVKRTGWSESKSDKKEVWRQVWV